MKITIEIPKEFEEHFINDRFEESLTRIESDITFHNGILSGLYEIELIKMLRNAFSKGVKENGTVWHDLRKNPNDLPKRYKHANIRHLVITNKGIGHYNFIKKTWYIYNAECNCSFFDTVIAWCEIPKFEEIKE